MWRINNIKAENFMSFNEVEYSLEGRCYIIKSENRDNSGQFSNGGGKTSFMDIIAVSLLGYSITGRNVKDCVRWATVKKYFTVQLTMSNSLTGETCFISRKIYSGSKGQEVVILINGKTPELPSKLGVEGALDVKLANKYILDTILDVSENDILSYFLISSPYYKPFLKINTDEKLAVISRFSNTKVIEGIISDVDKIRIEKTEETSRSISDLGKNEEVLKALREQLLKMDDKDRREKIEAKIKEADAVMESKRNKVNELTSKLASIDERRKSLLDEQIKEIKHVYTSLDNEINVLKRDLIKVNNYLAGLIDCPKCSHRFSLNENVDLTEEDRDMLKGVISEKEIELEGIAKRRHVFDEEYNDMLRKIVSNGRLDSEINTLNREIQSLILEKDTLICNLEKGAKTDTTSINEQIKEYEERCDKNSVDIRETSSLADIYEAWVSHFDNFKFYLGNIPIAKICGLINDYLQLNESDLNVSIEPYKKLRSGELRQNLQPVIYRNWENPQSYEQFSEGEKVRLNISVDLTFQKLINGGSKSGGLDIYCNDELMNGLDSVGISNAAKAFDKLGKTILMVSHSGAELCYENTIDLVKEEGVTRLKD